jgi:hypothetical protein
MGEQGEGSGRGNPNSTASESDVRHGELSLILLLIDLFYRRLDAADQNRTCGEGRVDSLNKDDAVEDDGFHPGRSTLGRTPANPAGDVSLGFPAQTNPSAVPWSARAATCPVPWAVPTQPNRTAHARDGRRTNQTSVLLKAPSPDRCLPSYPSPPAYPSRGACCSRFFAVRGAGDHARCGHPKTRGRHAGAASPIRNALAPAGNNTGAGRLRRVLNVPLLHHRDKKDSLPPHRSSLADYNSHLPSSNLLP